MEQDPWCKINNLYGECESQFLEMIGVELSREWREVYEEQLYEVSRGKEKERIFLLGNGRS
jgi:hypothetical protein